MKKADVMIPVIDKEKTGRQIRTLMERRGLSVQDVRAFLSLGCVQSIYQVPMDMLVAGDRRYHPKNEIRPGAERLLRYYRLIQDCMAA